MTLSTLKSEADMFSYKMQNVEEQCQVARRREEEAREETSKLQNKCDSLETGENAC